jgi:hypothetical protein
MVFGGERELASNARNTAQAQDRYPPFASFAPLAKIVRTPKPIKVARACNTYPLTKASD